MLDLIWIYDLLDPERMFLKNNNFGEKKSADENKNNE